MFTPLSNERVTNTMSFIMLPIRVGAVLQPRGVAAGGQTQNDKLDVNTRVKQNVQQGLHFSREGISQKVDTEHKRLSWEEKSIF